ncbi:catechol 2,3-dioxygenase-like lactoylglutathione lyase family enzyme [Methanococcus voltae]|uniref:VOC family protein n=1 Tax=Methanococcus voltae TaxID=2188 RepID=UPI001AEA8A2C|nr:catechol 2,3-dioxygenase-like lactoylglutathione lyase family enzyme [Methanococcus voltae]
MKYITTLLAVKDINISKKFYEKLFNQHVIYDLGKNVTFDGGFALQEDFPWLIDIPANSLIKKSNNMELYFEVDDFDEFLKKLEEYEKYEKIVYVNKPKKHEWKQRVVRIYDPDFHIIEIGESMEVIAKRYLNEGYSIEKTAEIIQHPIEFVKMVNEKQ